MIDNGGMTMTRYLILPVAVIVLATALIWIASNSIFAKNEVVKLRAELPVLIINAVKEAVSDRYTGKDATKDKELIGYHLNDLKRRATDHEKRLTVLENTL